MPLVNNSLAFSPSASQAPSLGGLPTSSPISSTIRSWHKRYQSAVNAGIPGEPIIAMARADIQRVSQGKSPMNNLQAATATRARLMGKGDALGVKEGEDNGSFFGNVISDIGDIGQALNPLHLIPALGKEAVSVVSHPGTTLQGFGHLLAGIGQLGPLTHGGTEELGKALETPGIRFIPGLTTAYNLGHDPSQLLKHPLQTVLDVAPYAGTAAKFLTGAIGGEEAASALSKFKAGKEALKTTGEIPEALQLSQRERLMSLGLQRHPLKMAAQAIAPDAVDMARAGTLAFQTRMGFGPIARYQSRMANIDQRTAQIAAKDLMTPFNEAVHPLSQADKELSFQVATRPDLHAPGSYPEHITTAVQATRNLGRQMEELSQDVPGHELVRVPDIHGNEQVFNRGVPEEAKVISAYERTLKYDERINDIRTDLAAKKSEVADDARVAQETKITNIQNAYDKAAAGRVGVNAPGRSFVGLEAGKAISQRFNDSITQFLDNQDALKTQPIELVYGRISEYNGIRNWMDANPDATVQQIIDHVKGNLSAEDKKLLVQHLEDAGISHIQQPRGKELDVWSKLGVRKPGAIRTTQPQPSRAAQLLEQLQNEKDRLDSGEYLDTHPEVKKLTTQLNNTQRKALDVHQEFLDRRASTPPASMQPILASHIENEVQRRYLKEQTAKLVGGDYAIARTLPEALHEYTVTADPAHLIPQAEYEAITSDIASTWQDVVKQLQDEGKELPTWVHNVGANAAKKQMYIGKVGESIRTASSLKRRAIDPADSIADVEVAMTAAGRDLMEKKWHAAFIENHILPYTRTLDQIKPELLNQAAIDGAKQGLLSERNWYNKLMGDRYVKFDPHEMFGFTNPRLERYAADHGELWIPKDIANTARQLLRPSTPSELGRVAGKINQLFKFSVIGLSPKHMADVLFADNMWVMLRAGKEEFKWSTIKESIDAVLHGHMPVELSQHLDLLAPDQLLEAGVGKKMGTFLKTHGRVTNVITSMYRMEETVNNIQRMVSFIGERERGLKAGLGDEAAHSAALEHAWKTTLDIDNLVPFERTILKQVFPFYSFFRYLLHYVYTYPFDHPYRTAIINKVANIERTDWDSGLPQMFQNYFNLGQPNRNGDQKTIDIRAINPFKDLGNSFTFAGFISQLNPLITETAKLAGVNTLAATPELYPQMKYDPQSGKMIPATPSISDALYGYASAIVPQVGLVDFFATMTQQMRQLKASNPEAYKRVLYRNLFLPFTPRTINLPEERQKAALNRLTEAQNAVSNTLKTGESLPGKFNLVPYQGKLVPRSYIEALIKQTKQYSAAPKSVLSRN